MSQAYYKSFIKDNFIVICGVALVYIKGIILMPIIIKSVGVTIYGGFILVTSILGIAFGLSSFGAGFRAKRFMPSAKSMTERGDIFYPQFYFNILIILILSLLFVLLEKPLNTYLFKNEVSFSIWIIPFYLVLYLLYSQGTDYFRYTSRIHYMTLAILCFPYLHIGFILLYIYAYGSISINMLVISTALSALLIAIPSFGVIIREIGTKISFYKAGSLVSDIKLGFPLILGFIVDIILAGGDRYFIAFYLSVTDVGYYVPGYVLGSLIVFIPKALGTALPQLLSRAVDSGNESEAQTMLNYAIKIYLLLAIPFIFGCLALSKPILTLLANQEVAEKAFWVTPIVALGTLFYGLNIILSNVMYVRLKTNAMFKMNLIAALFSLFANFVLFYFFRNIIVAAITTFLSFFIAFVYVYRIVIKEWFVSFYPATIAKAFAASVIMYSVICFVKITFVQSDIFGVLVLEILLGTLVYAGALFIFKTFSQKELEYSKSLFHDIIT
jgi:O-antigen/teichoic acid export membrane protein